jgi:succinyl-diaminopimelate desuccinylase
MIDPVALAQELIRCRSVTPADDGALAVLEETLVPLGFRCRRMPFAAPGTAPVDNLYARLGQGSPVLVFAGHTDVVPPGDAGLWRADPFAGEIRDGVLYGRGAADMKSAIAAFAAAVEKHLAGGSPQGSIALLITGDEEGPGINGTQAMLRQLSREGEHFDHCIVGEPTATAASGDTLKIGRRGSLTLRFLAKGVQGHVAYPKRARNPIPPLADLVTQLAALTLDEGTAHFEPSSLVFTAFDVGNPATNVSPAEARATCNIRFNDRHSASSLEQTVAQLCRAVSQRHDCTITCDASVGGEVFLTEPGPFVALVSGAVARVTGAPPALSTTGGTSDARFIKDYCPVVELGLPGVTMHKADECAPLDEIHRLAAIYESVLHSYFAADRL